MVERERRRFANASLSGRRGQQPWEELVAFRATAKELGYGSVATAALVAWEWLQPEEHVFGAFGPGFFGATMNTASRLLRGDAKCLKGLVGAPGLEPGTR